ncbi:MAG TPA: hypothetical protein PLK31_22840 [Chloroflexota bacterium]|nr:hypothetical protein [Chloroflexota bacterium]
MSGNTAVTTPTNEYKRMAPIHSLVTFIRGRRGGTLPYPLTKAHGRNHTSA